MKILVDPSIFRYGRCGMTRYYAAVCRGLQANSVQLTIPLLSSNCDFRPGIAAYMPWLRRLPKVGRLLDHLSKLQFERLVRRGEFDCILVTCPSFTRSFLSVKPDARFVMIVHDLMSCVVAPDGLYDAAGPGFVALQYLARRASRVVCISEDTRQALLKQGSVDENRVVVVRTGNLLAASAPAERELSLPSRYLLFVGERTGRKGFYALVRTLQTVFAANPDLHLICTGCFRAEEIDFIQQYISLDRVRAVPADDGTLVTLYRNAVCLIYPSLYEGFGLPVIEAMHYGCPVITTNCGALAEIAGSAAAIVRPDVPEEMLSAIDRMLNDQAYLENCRAEGQRHAASFEEREMMIELVQEIKQAISA